jgi:NitT/TauT family transport system ATP-binding protein
MVLPVLDDVSFSLQSGEFLALIGPSGCGKSTMLDIEPDVGAIAIDGVRTTAQDRLGRSAYMHQRDLLLPWRKAVDNAAIALQIQGVSRSTARSVAAGQFAAFGLAGFENKYPAQLSGGMRQRVAFVRTMLGGQRLVLLDEPFGSLDALTRTAAQDWLAAGLARDRRTTLLVTHDVDEAILLADRVLVMSGRPGHVVHVEPIKLPRPRSRSFLLGAEFAAHRLQIMTHLGIVDAGAGVS